jgi:uncharacterized protein (DUF3820 family)
LGHELRGMGMRILFMDMPFGKYKGMDILDVPLTYLQWLEEQSFVREPLRKEIQFELERRTGDRPGQGKVVKPAK